MEKMGGADRQKYSERQRRIDELKDAIRRFGADESGSVAIGDSKKILAATAVVGGLLAGGIALERGNESKKEDLPHISAPSIVPDKPDTLERKELTESEMDVLAQNVYHEARGESPQGQLAVAQVTLARVGKLAKNVTEAVFQDRQFSWTDDPKIIMSTRNENEFVRVRELLRSTIGGKNTEEAVKALAAITHVPEDVMHYKSTSLKENDPEEKRMSQKSKNFFKGMTVVKTIGSHAFYAKIPMPKSDPRKSPSARKKLEA